LDKNLAAKADQMKKLDEIAVSSGLEIRQMMELAAYHIAQYCIERFQGKKIGIYVGSGNNGGDGIAAARFLYNAGIEVEIILLKPESEIKDDGKHHLELCRKIGVNVREYIPGETIEYDVVIDGLIGYALQGDPESPYKECIEQMNASEAIIVSIDIPSGFDSNAGKSLEPCVRADATLFLAYPKFGYKNEEHDEYFGECYLIDLGIPKMLYEEVKLAYPFS
jgi:NAD(P)H-hydrate epimerase